VMELQFKWAGWHRTDPNQSQDRGNHME